MKICLINNLFSPLKAGGAEKIVENIATILTGQGHEVVVLTIGVGKLQSEIKDGYKIVRLANKFIYHRIDSDKQSTIRKFIFHWQNVFCDSHAKQARAFFNGWTPDLIWTHNLSGFGWQINKIIKVMGLRHWHEIHDFQLINPFGTFLLTEKNKLNNLPLVYKIYSSLARKMFNHLELVISPSKFLLDEYKKNNFFNNCRSEIIYNPFIDQSIDVIPLEDAVVKKFLYIGQLEKYKGILTLIAAFRASALEDVELVVVGEGSLISELNEVATKDKRLKVLGWQSTERVKKLISEAQVVVYPSECYENLPTVITESLSLGRPVLASNIGGISEMINDGQTGWLVGAGNEIEWKKILKEITNNQQPLNILSLRAAVEAKRYSINEYSKLLFNLL